MRRPGRSANCGYPTTQGNDAKRDERWHLWGGKDYTHATGETNRLREQRSGEESYTVHSPPLVGQGELDAPGAIIGRWHLYGSSFTAP
jgi:hypothetical protein